jgi:hypothetical protein
MCVCVCVWCCAEVETWTNDNIVFLLRFCQLLIEYLLHVQNYLLHASGQNQSVIAALQKDLKALQKVVDAAREDERLHKKELHHVKKLLRTYQQTAAIGLSAAAANAAIAPGGPFVRRRRRPTTSPPPATITKLTVCLCPVLSLVFLCGLCPVLLRAAVSALQRQIHVRGISPVAFAAPPPECGPQCADSRGGRRLSQTLRTERRSAVCIRPERARAAGQAERCGSRIGSGGLAAGQ